MTVKNIYAALGLAAALVIPTTGMAASPLTKAFAECLLSKGMAGSYTSADGGKSAMRLMVGCDAQWKPWQNECMADGESDGDCTVQAAILAQVALKLAGK